MWNTRGPIPPGAVLRNEFMAPLGLNVRQLAHELHVPVTQLQEVVAGRRPVKAGLALRLGRYFGVHPETWLNLQANYDLHKTERQIGRKIEQMVMPLEAA